MNPNPNQNYNIIKGLQIFINDIRACNTREAESKRVENELDKIRKKFSAGKALSGYEKKKCVWKLLYIYILGYRVDFGHSYACDLITSIKFSEKSTGYIAMSILFKENTSEIGIMVNSIRNDLLNQNSFCQSMALTLSTNLNDAELLNSIAQDVLKFMTSFGEKQQYTVKKALICLTKIVKTKPEVHDSGTWSKYLIKMLDLRYFEVLLACGSLILNLVNQFGTTNYEELIVKFFNNVLYKMKECPEDYIYYHIKAPWLQIKILKLIQMLSPNSSFFDISTINHIKEYVDYIAKKTQTITSAESKYSRYYAEYCIFFEVVNLIDHLNLKFNYKTFDTYINILGSFLQDDHRKYPNKDINTKYLSLDGMAKLSKYTSGNKILKEHSAIILSSLRDNDISIRRRALDLLFLTCTEDSVKMICKELLLYLKEDEPQLKDDVTLKIAILSEKYAADYVWYVEVCLKMFELAGDFVSEDILYRIVQIIIGFENKELDVNLQLHACEKILKLLEKTYVFESVVKLAALILGEFGHLLEKAYPGENKYPLDKQISLIMKHSNICSNKTIYSILNSLIKFVNHNFELRTIVIPVFEQYLESWDTELQQRSLEFMILCKLDHEEFGAVSEIRQKMLEAMPVYSVDLFNNSLLMKRLQKTPTATYTNKTNQGLAEKKPSQDRSSTVKNVEDQVVPYTGVSPYANHILYIKNPSGFAAHMNKFPDHAVLLSKESLQNNFDMFKSLITSQSGGLIYSDENLKVNLVMGKIDHGNLGYKFGFMPSVGGKLEDVEFKLSNYLSNELLNVSISNIKYDQYPQAMMKVNLVDSFNYPPLVKLSGTLGMRRFEVDFAIPALITKFLEPCDVPLEKFTTMWHEISESPEETCQKMDSIMTNPMFGTGKTHMEFLKKLGALLTNLHFKVFPPNDVNNFHEIEGISILTTKDGSINVLFQASFVPSNPEEFRFSLRSRNSNLEKFSTLLLDIYAIVKFYVNP